MQQRVRVALEFMIGEMRMAGYNPPNDYPEPNAYDPYGNCDDASILTASSDELEFEFCELTSDQGNPPTYTAEMKKTRYALYDAYDDGVLDLGVAHDNGNLTPLAEGIEAIEFLYLDAKGETEVTNPADIRQIRISILARSTNPDRKHIDKVVYEPASVRDDFSTDTWDINGDDAGGTTGNPPTCDDPDNPYEPCHYHRRLLITTVKLRNMGLEE